jgi:hypothetical protein
VWFVSIPNISRLDRMSDPDDMSLPCFSVQVLGCDSEPSSSGHGYDKLPDSTFLGLAMHWA